MALPSSGQISLSQIAAEFGGTSPDSMSEYYGAGGAPSSGALSFADFYGLSANPTYYIVSGGGSGGPANQGSTPPGAGGGGAGGNVIIGNDLQKNPGETWDFTVGAGGLAEQTGGFGGFSRISVNGGFPFVIANGGARGSADSYDDDRGGAGGGRSAANVGDPGPAETGERVNCGAGGASAINGALTAVAGGGGGSGRSVNAQSAGINSSGQVFNGVGGAGYDIPDVGQGSPYIVGAGGSGGLVNGLDSGSVTNGGSGAKLGGGNVAAGKGADDYGGGGGGGARLGGTVFNMGAGGEGVIFVVYDASEPPAASTSGSVTTYTYNGKRIYKCTYSIGSITW